MIAKPFLKWAGGKRKLLKEISNLLPDNIDSSTIYIEPFVGGGSVLFWILSNYKNIGKVIINDINNDLMNTYRVVANNPKELIEILKTFQNEYYLLDEAEERKKYYYNKRNLFNLRNQENTLHAALFIFLNRTCFNGLYRVNKKNEFNVPIGSYIKPLICDETNINEASKALRNVIILNGDYYDTIRYINNNKNCLFYLDPPYKPLSKTANFNKYSNFIFDDSEQERLKGFCDLLSEKKINWILSNSDLKNYNKDNIFFDLLYKEFKINRVSASRVINNNSKDKIIKELLITNEITEQHKVFIQ
ncbi:MULTISPECIES: DNA adenine methylase [unclassified Chryseobacterium]|uniref:DNA adenine methylase n=1 Tax=unclassified Chryseobacterium TaxID=2593645 RepID=UPI0028532745|nr:Dam family site-specific DNA-(adenine-N6)-methyltransferase [Chryseobacterium sp. CFS7]MDR4892718.1 Dam family site-specific DNA-(adenine-N6)-methyltransferase [Chryseobacterium sp. CFS7]